MEQSGLTLAFCVAGAKVLLTPAQAYARALPFTVLQPDEVSTLESLANILLPGATRAGVAHFVDQQLGIDPNDSLLILKYFNYPPPYVDFYRSALQAIRTLRKTLYGSDVARLNQTDSRKLIEMIRDQNPPDWAGPPAPLVYHAIRNDAVDVVYGTVEGFRKLNVPYMAHIMPPPGWEE